MYENRISRLAMLAAAALLASPAWAQTEVKEAWVRGTVAQQKATGAFMQITSRQGGKLVSVASPVAGLVEIHQMKMDGNMMKMAAVPSVELPAGKAVEFKPGGYHVMLMDLKQTIKAGDTVPLTLAVEGADGKKEAIEVRAPVKALGAKAEAPAHEHAGH